MHVNQVRITYDNFFKIIFKFIARIAHVRLLEVSIVSYILFRVVYNTNKN